MQIGPDDADVVKAGNVDHIWTKFQKLAHHPVCMALKQWVVRQILVHL